LRFGTIYGLSGRTRFDLVVNLLSAKAVVEGEITIFGGDQWRPFLHVDDAALSIITALSAPLDLVRNQIYNVGSNEQNFTINQVGEMVQRQVPSAKIVHLGDGSDKRNYWVSFNKIRDNLGFQPAWQIDDGIKQVINAIQSGAVDDYRNAKYSNVKFLSEEGIYKLSKTEDGWAYHLIYDDDKSIPLPVKA
jgi:nucleoside-diphosphate-sugar epimerase